MTYTPPPSPSSPPIVSPLPPLPSLPSLSNFIFYDPAPLAPPSAPGWPLRNLFALMFVT